MKSLAELEPEQGISIKNRIQICIEKSDRLRRVFGQQISQHRCVQSADCAAGLSKSDQVS
jgi:hypothetical protein